MGLAASALEMLARVKGPTTSPAEDAEPEIGQPLAKGEQPHAQACVLFVLRVAVLERLGEAGQVKRHCNILIASWNSSILR